MAYDALSKGVAADKFRQMIRSQGGDERVVDNPDLLPRAGSTDEIRSPSHGFVTRCDARFLGLASNALGAGRTHVDDTVYRAVGLFLEKKSGDPVERGDVLCRIHWNDSQRLRKAMAFIDQAFEIQPHPPKHRPLIHAVLEG